MIKSLFRITLFIAIGCFIDSCSDDSPNDQKREVSSKEITDYTYNTSELETMKLINDYRLSIGLNALEKINHVSFKSEEHNNYMIANNVVNHDDFVARSENIIKVLGAKNVSENIAYNYKNPKGAFDAWMNSPGHRENIIGKYTNFGISVRQNPVNGKSYYTNIFVKF